MLGVISDLSIKLAPYRLDSIVANESNGISVNERRQQISIELFHRLGQEFAGSCGQTGSLLVSLMEAD